MARKIGEHVRSRILLAVRSFFARPKVTRLLDAFLRPINIAGPVMFSIHMILWGLWLLMPFDVFAKPAFATLADMAPENDFGYVSLITGIVAFYAAMKNRPDSLATSSFIGFLYWFLMATCFAIADYTSTGVLTYYVISIYSAFTYLNIKYNVKHNRWPSHVR